MKKAEIRKICLEKRAQLSEADLLIRQNAVLPLLQPLLPANRTIASFKAIPHRNELSLDSLIGDFAFPRVLSEDVSMEMAKSPNFVNSHWGILEPVGGVVLNPSDFDIVLIPLLAFDLAGNRVGYGKGFYDRYLVNCRPNCLKIGISLFDPVTLIEDVEGHDIRLDIAICPAQLYDFR